MHLFKGALISTNSSLLKDPGTKTIKNTSYHHLNATRPFQGKRASFLFQSTQTSYIRFLFPLLLNYMYVRASRIV
jgi:hypothetical protein